MPTGHRPRTFPHCRGSGVLNGVRSFGQVAGLYERWRPGYPDALYADVLKFGPRGRCVRGWGYRWPAQRP
jgi:hypothetical protein